MISGVTLIRNGNILGYPWELCIRQMLPLCDEVIVNCDPGDDNTLWSLRGLKKKFSKIKIIENKWNMNNTGDGRELASQINNVLSEAKYEWIVYLQADELLHQKDHASLREYIYNIQDMYSQIELYRTYFWGSLKQRMLDHEIWLGRIFRKDTHTVGGDGMFLVRETGEVIRSPYWIYHYSRMGNEDTVNRRLRNLDTLFHPKEDVEKFHPFSYKLDSEGKHLVDYTGSHPIGIKEFY